MEYDLAKELADNNFPQDGNGTLGCKHGGHAVGTRHCEEDVYFPTLSELIEACGEEFDALFGPYSSLNSHEGVQIREWRVDSVSGICTDGHSAEEAVARLWLALQKERAS